MIKVNIINIDSMIISTDILKFTNKNKNGYVGSSICDIARNYSSTVVKTMITMGIANEQSKEKSLREMGLNDELVQFNLVGNR